MYWQWQLFGQWWIRWAALAVYGIFPLFIVKMLHKEELTSRLGLKKRLPLIGLPYCVASLGVVVVSAALTGYYRNDLPNYLSGLVLAPVVEEIFFRGYVLGSISKLHKYVAVGVSAMLFGASHYVAHVPFAFSVFFVDTAAGLWLAVIYLYSGSILVPMIHHQALNIFSFIYNTGFYPPYDFPWNFMGVILYFAPISAALVIFYEFLKKPPRPSCWICGKTESEIRGSFPHIKDVLEKYPVEGSAVNICFVCRRLVVAVSEKKYEEG